MPSQTTSRPRPAGSASLKQQAYRSLKRLILSGELSSGRVLSVRQLAAQLGMSRTPVHAAIERLEADGLVTLAPQQGVLVRQLSIQDIVNHYQLRDALEPYLVRRLAGKLSPDQVRKLRENLSRYKQAVRKQQVDALVDVDAEFHQLLVEFLGNGEIIAVMQQIRNRIQSVVYRLARSSPERIRETYEEHKAILNALVAGDGDQAAKLVHEHLERGLRRFLPAGS